MRIASIHGRHALVLACAAALAFSADPARASGTLDVTCTPGHNGFAIFSYGYRAAVVFTPTKSGKLLAVDFKNIARGAGSGGDITVELHAVDGGGIPTDPVLASTAIPSASISIDNYYHDYSASFAPASAYYLNGGQKYAIAITTTDSAQDSWAFHDGDLCPGIEVFQNLGSGWSQQFTAGMDAGFAISLGPPNDDFARAQALSGSSPSATGTTAGGTRESGEPDHYTIGGADIDYWVGDHTVWYRWTALGSGSTTIDTCTAAIDSILAVYTGGTLAGLSRVTDNNNNCPSGWGSKVTFSATVGTSYAIAVGDAGGARENTFTLAIAGIPGPPITTTTTLPPTTSTTTSTTSTTTTTTHTTTTTSTSSTTLHTTTTLHSTTSTSSTTSTTLPACGEAPTYGSIACGLEMLVTRVDTATDLGQPKRGLLGAATKARAMEQQAEGFITTGTHRQEKSAMKKALKALTSFLRKANSRAAKKHIPLATRQALIDQASPILASMKTLIGAL